MTNSPPNPYGNTEVDRTLEIVDEAPPPEEPLGFRLRPATGEEHGTNTAWRCEGERRRQVILANRMRGVGGEEPIGRTEPKPRLELFSKDQDRTSQSWLWALAHLGWEYRFNTRTKADEFRRADAGWADWREVDDRLITQIVEDLNGHYTWGVGPRQNLSIEACHRLADATREVQEVDPFIEWIEDLPQWDGKERLPKMFDTYFVLAPGYEDLAGHAAYSVLGGAIRRSYEPGCKHDETVVLLGPPGTGKSSFWEALLPVEQAQAWFCDDVSLDRVGAKEAVEPTLGAVLVELSELAGLRKADIEKYKAWATRKVDRCRLAYRRNAEKIPRRWIAVGTSNHTGSAFPADLGAGRRLIAVEVTAGRGTVAGMQEQLAGPEGEQLWAEAYYRYQCGWPTWPSTDNLTRAHEEAYQRHRQPVPMEDLLRPLSDNPTYAGKNLTLAGLGEALDMGTPTSWPAGVLGQVTQALGTLGWKKGRERQGSSRLTVYQVPFPDEPR